MAGTIAEFFGYRIQDRSRIALESAARQECPFLHGTCSKHLSDGKIADTCAIRQITGCEAVICCRIGSMLMTIRY